MAKKVTKLRVLRWQYGLKQSEMAAILGVKSTYYSRLELGNAYVRGSIIDTLEGYFNRSVDDLLSEVEV